VKKNLELENVSQEAPKVLKKTWKRRERRRN
jgi:hypothetical protein